MLRSAVAALPDSKELLALAGQRAVDDDDYEVAIQRLEQALRIDPGYGPALIWLSTAYDKLGRKADAVAAARRAVAARPGPVAYAVLAQSLAIGGDRPGAAAAVQQVYSSGKEIPYYVSEMIWPVHAYAGDWKQAEAELRRWTGPDALPTRRLMSLSALSFVLNAQGREREVRDIADQARGGRPGRVGTLGEGDVRDAVGGLRVGIARFRNWRGRRRRARGRLSRRPRGVPRSSRRSLRPAPCRPNCIAASRRGKEGMPTSRSRSSGA